MALHLFCFFSSTNFMVPISCGLSFHYPLGEAFVPTEPDLLIFATLLATLIVWLYYLQKKFHSVKHESSDVIQQGPLKKVASPSGPKVVIDHGKALCQMVKFSIRFKRKLRRLREKKRLEVESSVNPCQDTS